MSSENIYQILRASGLTMNPFHLIWIIPLCVLLGIFIAALLSANKESSDD